MFITTFNLAQSYTFSREPDLLRLNEPEAYYLYTTKIQRSLIYSRCPAHRLSCHGLTKEKVSVPLFVAMDMVCLIGMCIGLFPLRTMQRGRYWFLL